MDLKINIDDTEFVKKERQKEQIKNGLYQQIVNICCKYIKLNNDLGMSQCIYQMPIIVSGYPLYDVQSALPIIMLVLRRNGYIVKYIPKINIHIDWSNKKNISNSIKKITEEPKQQTNDKISEIENLYNEKSVQNLRKLSDTVKTIKINTKGKRNLYK